jgi:hypothetical protein
MIICQMEKTSSNKIGLGIQFLEKVELINEYRKNKLGTKRVLPDPKNKNHLIVLTRGL